MMINHLARRLKAHDRFCKIHTGERYCSCGRDEAIEELVELMEAVERALPPHGPRHEMSLPRIRRRLGLHSRKSRNRTQNGY